MAHSSVRGPKAIGFYSLAHWPIDPPLGPEPLASLKKTMVNIQARWAHWPIDPLVGPKPLVFSKNAGQYTSSLGIGPVYWTTCIGQLVHRPTRWPLLAHNKRVEGRQPTMSTENIQQLSDACQTKTMYYVFAILLSFCDCIRSISALSDVCVRESLCE